MFVPTQRAACAGADVCAQHMAYQFAHIRRQELSDTLDFYDKQKIEAAKGKKQKKKKHRAHHAAPVRLVSGGELSFR